MATMKQWDEEIAKLNMEQSEEIGLALKRLLDWPFFKKEYAEFGLGTIQHMVSTRFFELEKAARSGVEDLERSDAFCIASDYCEQHSGLLGGNGWIEAALESIMETYWEVKWTDQAKAWVRDELAEYRKM